MPLKIANVLLNVGRTTCSASGFGLDKAELFIPATFKAESRPLIEAGVEVSSVDFVAIISGPFGQLPVEISPSTEEPGVFEVAFTPKDIGQHRVATSLKGQEILNSPIVVAKTSATASGLGLEKGEQSTPAVFTVDASPLFKAGVPAKSNEVEVKVAGPTGPVDAHIIPNNKILSQSAMFQRKSVDTVLWPP